jgi:hypothetical protein
VTSVFVLTVDQRGSRRGVDLVDELLTWLGGQAREHPVVRPFERTAGDEVQGVLDDPAEVVDLTLALVRADQWSVGIGVGPVDEPLPESTRAGSGPAFVLARRAVTRAKNAPSHLAVAALDERASADAQAVLDLLASGLQRRTEPGWEAVDLVQGGLTQSQAADRLGITKQAVSQRLRAAAWSPELGGRTLAAKLLAAADTTPREDSSR